MKSAIFLFVPILILTTCRKILLKEKNSLNPRRRVNIAYKKDIFVYTV